MIASGLGSMITDFVLHGTKPQGVAGPIGVAQLTGEAVRAGWFAVLWFMALLSLNLAVLNILPIPALDGGRFFFMIIEMLTGKKVSPKYEAYAHGVGLVLLLGLMAVVTILDIVRLLQGKSIIP
jgi:regulator of sigma E protease